MDFKVQYILLDGCKLPVEPQGLIRKSFDVKPFEGFSLNVQKTNFQMAKIDSSKTYYRNIAEQLWDDRIYELADFTVVFCNHGFYNELVCKVNP